MHHRDGHSERASERHGHHRSSGRRSRSRSPSRERSRRRRSRSRDRDRGCDDRRARSHRPKRSRSRSHDRQQSSERKQKSRSRHRAGNLIIVCAGNDSLHEQCKWYGGKDTHGARNFDLCINYFGTDEGVAARYAQQLRLCEGAKAPVTADGAGSGSACPARTKGNDCFFRYKGAKWIIVRQILANHEFWRSYRYVWMPDDDLKVS